MELSFMAIVLIPIFIAGAAFALTRGRNWVALLLGLAFLLYAGILTQAYVEGIQQLVSSVFGS